MIIKKSGIDYTPDVTFKEPFTNIKTLHLGDTPLTISVQASVPGNGEENLLINGIIYRVQSGILEHGIIQKQLVKS